MVFWIVDILTFRNVPQPDFKPVDFRTVIEDEIHPLINKKQINPQQNHPSIQSILLMGWMG